MREKPETVCKGHGISRNTPFVDMPFKLRFEFRTRKRDIGGWGKDSPYNQLYESFEIDSFKGLVVKTVKVIPLPGMSPGVALTVRERGNENVMVHLGPKWFIGKVGIKKGDRGKVKGVWAEI